MIDEEAFAVRLRDWRKAGTARRYPGQHYPFRHTFPSIAMNGFINIRKEILRT